MAPNYTAGSVMSKSKDKHMISSGSSKPYETDPGLNNGPNSFLRCVNDEGWEHPVNQSSEQTVRKNFVSDQDRSYSSGRTGDRITREASDKPIFVINLNDRDPELEKLLHNDSITYISKRNFVSRTSGQKYNTFPLQHILELSKDIWIICNENVIKETNSDNTRIINDVAKYRRKAAEEANLSDVTFPMHILTYSETNRSLESANFHNKISIPHTWPERRSIVITSIKEKSVQTVTSILLECLNNRPVKITNLLKTTSKGAFCKLQIELVPNNSEYLRSSDIQYFKDAYSALCDQLDDANGALRQEFHRLHRLPNVRVAAKVKDDPDRHGRVKMYMILELRLLNFQGFQRLQEVVAGGALAVSMEESIRVRGEPLNGHVKVKLISEETDIRSFFEEEESSASFQSQVPMLKRTIVTKLYDEHLNNPQKLPYDFWTELQKVGCISLIDSVRNSKGENAMHMAITAGRLDFLKMIFYMNRWAVMRQEISMPSTSTTSLPTHTGYTPRRLAEALAFKTKGQMILEEYDKLENTYLKLLPLGMACLSGRLDLVKILIESQPASLKDDRKSAPMTCLQVSCGAGHYKIVKYLLQQKARATEQDCCPHLAAIFGHTKVLKVLSEYLVDIVGRPDKENLNLNAVDLCAMNGDVESLKLFKEKNFSLRATSLALAVKYSRKDAVEFLGEECGVDVNAGGDEDGRLAIHHAVITGDVEAVKRQVLLKADISRLDKFGKNVIHLAAEYNQDVVLRELLLKLQSSGILGDLINTKDKYTGKDQYYLVRGRDRGRRAWHWLKLHRLHINLFKNALARGQLDVAEHGTILYSGFGASPDAETNRNMKELQEESLKPGSESYDMTPLHYAANKEHLAVVKSLLEYGAEPNLHDHSGATPLHLATMRGNLDIIVALENGGANLDMLTEDGQSCHDIADKNGHQHILNFLKAKSSIKNTEEFMKEALDKVKAALSEDVLMERRSQGKDIKRHIIDALRELTIDVNTFLLQMGSGPVLEATAD